MAVNNWKYGLTLGNIKAVMDSYKNEGNPPFRLKHNLQKNELETLSSQCDIEKKKETPEHCEKCPVISKKVDKDNTAKKTVRCEDCPIVRRMFFKEKLNECFSRELLSQKPKAFYQGNILFFLFGGYLKFIYLTPEDRSYLFNGERASYSEIFRNDLLEWKAIPEADGRWYLMKTQNDDLIPTNAISLLEFIIQTNEDIITKYCNSKSQDSQLKLLEAFSHDLDDYEKKAPKSVSQMDHSHVEILEELLKTLTDIANASRINGQHPRYLAEGLTWLLIASLLREHFPHDQKEFYDAANKAKVVAEEMGIVKTTIKDETRKAGYCLTIPPSVNRKVGLIGREDIVNRMGALLEKERSRVLLYGIGGIGKTTVMQWICEWITGKGNYTAWIDCRYSLKKEFLLFRSALDIPKSFNDEEACDRIIKELKTRFGSRLYLFLDGLPTNPSMDDNNILNALNSLNAHIMSTSRVDNVYFSGEELKKLEHDSAVQMFCKYYNRECENKEIVSKIISDVNGHTLLIELLAKAASKEGGSLDDFYQSMIENGVFDVFKRKVPTKQGNETIENCIINLYPLSELSPEQQRIMKLFTIFTPESEVYYKVAQWADLDMVALDELVDRALLGRGGAEGNYKILQIIRDSIARQMKNNNEYLMIENYGDLLEYAISTDRYMHRNLVFTIVQKRITLAEDIKEYLEKRIEKDSKEHSTEEETYWLEKTAILYNNLSGVYSMQGDYRLALDYIDKALKIRKRIYGNEHELIAMTYNNMSGIYRELGKYDEAMKYSMEALEIALKVLGTENQNTASIYNNLGGICHALHRYEEALCHYEKALKTRETLLGKEHPDTISVCTNIASVFLNQGEFELALEKLKDLEEVLQKEDLYKAMIYACIASAYLGLGNNEKAIEYNEKALKIREAILGVKHPETAKSYNSIADVYRLNGEYDEAQEKYKEAFKIREKKLGSEHPDTVSTLKCLEDINRMISDHTKLQNEG